MNNKFKKPMCLALCLMLLLTGCNGKEESSAPPAQMTEVTSATTSATTVRDMGPGPTNDVQFNIPANKEKFENLVSRMASNLQAHGIKVVGYDGTTSSIVTSESALPLGSTFAAYQDKATKDLEDGEVHWINELNDYKLSYRRTALVETLSLNKSWLNYFTQALQGKSASEVDAEAAAKKAAKENGTEAPEIVDKSADVAPNATAKPTDEGAEATATEGTAEAETPTETVATDKTTAQKYARLLELLGETGDFSAEILAYVEQSYARAYDEAYTAAYKAAVKEKEDAEKAEAEAAETTETEGAAENTESAPAESAPAATDSSNGGLGGLGGLGGGDATVSVDTPAVADDADVSVDLVAVENTAYTKVYEDLVKVSTSAKTKADKLKKGVTQFTQKYTAFSQSKLDKKLENEIKKTQTRQDDWYEAMFEFFVYQARTDTVNSNRWLTTLSEYLAKNVVEFPKYDPSKGVLMKDIYSSDFAKWQQKLVQVYETMPDTWTSPSALIYYNTLGFTNTEFVESHGLTTLVDYTYEDLNNVVHAAELQINKEIEAGERVLVEAAGKQQIPADKMDKTSKSDLANMIRMNFVMSSMVTDVNTAYPLVDAYITKDATVLDFKQGFAQTADAWGIPTERTIDTVFYAGSGAVATEVQPSVVYEVKYKDADGEEQTKIITTDNYKKEMPDKVDSITPFMDFTLFYQGSTEELTNSATATVVTPNQSEDVVALTRLLNSLWKQVDPEKSADLYKRMEMQNYPDFKIQELIDAQTAADDYAQLSLSGGRMTFNSSKDKGKTYKVLVEGDDKLTDEDKKQLEDAGENLDDYEPRYIKVNDRTSFAEIAQLLFESYYGIENGLPTRHLEDFGIEVSTGDEEAVADATGGLTIGGTPVAPAETTAESEASSAETTVTSSVADTSATEPIEQEPEEEEEEEFRLSDATQLSGLKIDEQGNTAFYNYFKGAFKTVVNEIDKTGTVWAQLCEYINFEELNYDAVAAASAAYVSLDQNEYGLIFNSGTKASLTQLPLAHEYSWRMTFMLNGEVTMDYLRSLLLDYVIVVGQMTGESYARSLDIAISALVNSTNEKNYTMGVDYYGDVALFSVLCG